jgi:hypothetical protein
MESSYSGRVSHRFDWRAMSEVYRKKGLLSKEQLDRLLEVSVGIDAMKIVGLHGWNPTHLILSEHRGIPLLTHFEAFSAAMGQPFVGIEEFFRANIRAGNFPAWYLNRTLFNEPPPGNLRIGQIMVALGLIDQSTLYLTLGIQSTVHDQLGVRPALASLALSLRTLSFPDFFQALGVQAGIPFESLDRSAPAIFDALGVKLARK